MDFDELFLVLEFNLESLSLLIPDFSVISDELLKFKPSDGNILKLKLVLRHDSSLQSNIFGSVDVVAAQNPNGDLP